MWFASSHRIFDSPVKPAKNFFLPFYLKGFALSSLWQHSCEWTNGPIIKEEIFINNFKKFMYGK
jgi:hypothetical protein